MCSMRVYLGAESELSGEPGQRRSLRERCDDLGSEFRDFCPRSSLASWTIRFSSGSLPRGRLRLGKRMDLMTAMTDISSGEE